MENNSQDGDPLVGALRLRLEDPATRTDDSKASPSGPETSNGSIRRDKFENQLASAGRFSIHCGWPLRVRTRATTRLFLMMRRNCYPLLRLRSTAPAIKAIRTVAECSPSGLIETCKRQH